MRTSVPHARAAARPAAALMLGSALMIGGFAALAGAARVAAEEAEVAVEAAVVEPGPALGAAIAETLSAKDQFGADRAFASLTGANGAVFFFNRSLDWCPFCIKQTVELAPRAQEFLDRGYGLAVLTIDTPEKLNAAAAKHQLAVTLLADPERTIVKALNLVDPQFADEAKHPQGSFGYALPYPVALVLDETGAVEAKVFAADVYGDDNAYRTRVTVDDVLAAVDAAAQAPAATGVAVETEAPVETPAVEPTPTPAD